MANKLVAVAGVQFPDTTLCNPAVDVLAETSPKFLYNHCIRTYVFGSLAVKAMGPSDGLVVTRAQDGARRSRRSRMNILPAEPWAMFHGRHLSRIGGF
jgi:hypothetical protein